MIERAYWHQLLEKNWQEKSVIWLSGIRRSGKTFICKSLPNIEYFDCELPSTRNLLSNPELFLKKIGNKRIILDEIHRISNPSELLKIAADHYPETKIIATGSSTLGASAKFKDTLTGRKRETRLTPMLFNESTLFGDSDLEHRFLFGGLPLFFLAKNLPENDFQEWMDAFWAKDIQNLFSLEKKYSFQKFFELLLVQSGGIFEATSFTGPCEVSRSTITNYLAILEATFVAHIIRPYSSRKATEIIAAPKIYGFDTGFVCFQKGWSQLHTQDLGLLWEHIVLNEIQGQLQHYTLKYWRDKQKHEIDFIFHSRHTTDQPTTIECKYSENNFDVSNLEKFRNHYPQGQNFVVLPHLEISYQKSYKNIIVDFVNLNDLITNLTKL
jgi:predicted AAA+ superfamily ATPase